MRKLTDLAMNSNRLRKVPKFLSSVLVPELKTLDLGDNAISEVGDDDLTGLGGLYGLRLAGNRISSMSNKTFAHVPNVHILNLAHNKVGGFMILCRVVRMDLHRKLHTQTMKVIF